MTKPPRILPVWGRIAVFCECGHVGKARTRRRRFDFRCQCGRVHEVQQ